MMGLRSWFKSPPKSAQLPAKVEPTFRLERKSTIDLNKIRSLVRTQSDSGVVITEHTALEISTVLAIVRRLSQDFAKLHARVVTRAEGGRPEPVKDHPLARILNRRANAWQTGFEFRETMTAHAILHGDAVAVKQIVGGKVDALIPLVPGQFSIEQRRGFRLVYTLFSENGEVVGEFGPDRVFHLRNLSWNGYRGLNLSQAARNVLGLSAALEGSQSAQLKNGSRPNGLLSTEEHLDDEQLEQIVAGWRAATSGANQYATPVLDSGMTFHPISMSAVDNQLIETRKHQVIEICAAFGMLPAVLGLDDKTQAFASLEAMMRAYVDQCLMPWMRRWSGRLDMDCLDKEGDLETLFDASELRKGSAKDQAEADVKLVNNGLRTINELRDRDGLAPLDGGDVPLRPLNVGPLEIEEDEGEDAAGDGDPLALPPPGQVAPVPGEEPALEGTTPENEDEPAVAQEGEDEDDDEEA